LPDLIASRSALIFSALLGGLSARLSYVTLRRFEAGSVVCCRPWCSRDWCHWVGIYAIGEFAIVAFRAGDALEEVGRSEDHVWRKVGL
jgi:hypothetical protein